MITVIVSVMNDEAGLRRTLMSLVPEKAGTEVLVVDGGSVDNSVRLARETPWVRLVKSKGSKGMRLNAAAARARGDLLLFLDSGAVLERGWPSAVEKSAGAPGFALGCFRLEIQNRNPVFRIVECASFLRTALWRVCRSSQAMFLRRADIDGEQIFFDVAALEDLDLSRRMKARGNVVQVRRHAIVPSDRWTRDGILRRCRLDTQTFFRWARGDQPNALASLSGDRKNAVVLFCMPPGPGKGKSGPVPSEPDRATRMYRRSVNQILATVERARINAKAFVFYRPRRERDELARWLGGRAMLVGQSGKTNMDRRRAAIKTVFESNCDSALILDTRCPAMTEKHLSVALESLVSNDIVLGPTSDGGCYLVGFKQPFAEGFGDIAWSGDDLPGEIYKAGCEHGLKIANLETLRDCDTADGLAYNWAMGHVQA